MSFTRSITKACLVGMSKAAMNPDTLVSAIKIQKLAFSMVAANIKRATNVKAVWVMYNILFFGKLSAISPPKSVNIAIGIWAEKVKRPRADVDEVIL